MPVFDWPRQFRLPKSKLIRLQYSYHEYVNSLNQVLFPLKAIHTDLYQLYQFFHIYLIAKDIKTYTQLKRVWYIHILCNSIASKKLLSRTYYSLRRFLCHDYHTETDNSICCMFINASSFLKKLLTHLSVRDGRTCFAQTRD